MFNDCCASFKRAGLAVGAEKTHWSSTVVSNGMLMRAGEHDVLWERTLTFVGCELEPSGHSGAALAHRIVKANGVFSALETNFAQSQYPVACEGRSLWHLCG